MRIRANLSKYFLPAAFALTVSAYGMSLAADAPQLKLSVDEAVTTALKNNKSLQIQQLGPKNKKLSVDTAKAAFDTGVTGGLSASESESSSGATSRTAKADAGLSKKLAAGEEISISLSSSDSNSRNDSYSSGLGVSFTKPLYKNAGTDVNLAGIKAAEIDVKTSYLELQGYTDTLIEQVMTVYWNYALAVKKIAIYEDSLALAERQLEETKATVEVGKLAEIELVAARAEVALRKQALINAKGNCESLRVTLLRLLNPTSAPDFWDTYIVADDSFKALPVGASDIKTHVQTALASRADVNQAKLQLERGDIEIVKTKNGLLPYLGFFVNLGGTGYSGSFMDSYGGILSDSYDAQIGLNYSVTLGRRSEKAKHEQALLSKEQYTLAIENMEQTVQEDVRGAWIEIERASQQIEAAKASLSLQEEKLRAETEKFRVGKSTSITVAQAQRDYMQSQVDEAQAQADYCKAVVALLRSEGKLAEANSISLIP